MAFPGHPAEAESLAGVGNEAGGWGRAGDAPRGQGGAGAPGSFPFLLPLFRPCVPWASAVGWDMQFLVNQVTAGRNMHLRASQQV